MEYSGRLYGDREGAALPVTVRIAGNYMVVTAPGRAPMRWRLSRILLTDPNAFIYEEEKRGDTGEKHRYHLRFADPGTFEHVRAQVASAKLLPRDSGTRENFIWLVAGVAFIALFWWCWPYLSDPISAHIPASAEAALGTMALSEMEEKAPRCTGAPGAQGLLDGIAARLLASRKDGPQVDVRVLYAPGTVNAMALPGGHLVIYSGLVDAAESPDELAGVMAHELGHVIHRHPIRGMVRNSGFSLLMRMLFGSHISGSITRSLLTNIYSRDFERQADAEGLLLLKDAHIGNGGFAQFFARLEAKQSSFEGSPLFVYFTDHPALSERRAAITLSGPSVPPVTTEAEWQALRQICAPEAREAGGHVRKIR